MDTGDLRADALPSGNEPQTTEALRGLGYNWAAFLMPYPWLLGHGRLTWGMILLISASLPVISFAHILIYPIVAFYLGKKGYHIAWRYRPYHNLEQMQENHKEWFLWGVVFKVLFWLTFIFFGFYMMWFMQQPEFRELLEQMYPGMFG